MDLLHHAISLIINAVIVSLNFFSQRADRLALVIGNIASVIANFCLMAMMEEKKVPSRRHFKFFFISFSATNLLITQILKFSPIQCAFSIFSLLYSAFNISTLDPVTGERVKWECSAENVGSFIFVFLLTAFVAFLNLAIIYSPNIFFLEQLVNVTFDERFGNDYSTGLFRIAYLIGSFAYFILSIPTLNDADGFPGGWGWLALLSLFLYEFTIAVFSLVRVDKDESERRRRLLENEHRSQPIFNVAEEKQEEKRV